MANFAEQPNAETTANPKKEAKSVKEMTYSEAVTELGQILAYMQGDKCDIDKLSALTRRATELLKECRSRLTATDTELRGILTQLEEKETN
jgi:exodeoxyribonuclease VII small subunit